MTHGAFQHRQIKWNWWVYMCIAKCLRAVLAALVRVMGLQGACRLLLCWCMRVESCRVVQTKRCFAKRVRTVPLHSFDSCMQRYGRMDSVLQVMLAWRPQGNTCVRHPPSTAHSRGAPLAQIALSKPHAPYLTENEKRWQRLVH